MKQIIALSLGAFCLVCCVTVMGFVLFAKATSDVELTDDETLWEQEILLGVES